MQIVFLRGEGLPHGADGGGGLRGEGGNPVGNAELRLGELLAGPSLPRHDLGARSVEELGELLAAGVQARRERGEARFYLAVHLAGTGLQRVSYRGKVLLEHQGGVLLRFLDITAQGLAQGRERVFRVPDALLHFPFELGDTPVHLRLPGEELFLHGGRPCPQVDEELVFENGELLLHVLVGARLEAGHLRFQVRQPATQLVAGSSRGGDLRCPACHQVGAQCLHVRAHRGAHAINGLRERCTQAVDIAGRVLEGLHAVVHVTLVVGEARLQSLHAPGDGCLVLLDPGRQPREHLFFQRRAALRRLGDLAANVGVESLHPGVNVTLPAGEPRLQPRDALREGRLVLLDPGGEPREDLVLERLASLHRFRELAAEGDVEAVHGLGVDGEPLLAGLFLAGFQAGEVGGEIPDLRLGGGKGRGDGRDLRVEGPDHLVLERRDGSAAAHGDILLDRGELPLHGIQARRRAFDLPAQLVDESRLVAQALETLVDASRHARELGERTVVLGEALLYLVDVGAAILKELLHAAGARKDLLPRLQASLDLQREVTNLPGALRHERVHVVHDPVAEAFQLLQ